MYRWLAPILIVIGIAVLIAYLWHSSGNSCELNDSLNVDSEATTPAALATQSKSKRRIATTSKLAICLFFLQMSSLLDQSVAGFGRMASTSTSSDSAFGWLRQILLDLPQLRPSLLFCAFSSIDWADEFYLFVSLPWVLILLCIAVLLVAWALNRFKGSCLTVAVAVVSAF